MRVYTNQDELKKKTKEVAALQNKMAKLNVANIPFTAPPKLFFSWGGG